MRWSLAVPMITLGTLVICGPVLSDTLQADAQGAATKWDEAYNSGNMDALGKLYTADAIVVTKGMPQSGDKIQTFFSTLKSKGWEDHKTTVKTALPKDNLLIVSGRWEMTGPVEGGSKKKFEGNWVNVMERGNDGWRTVLHTWN
jgi:ketosteroid isomerase-like protein